jgi:hypothetical protein
MPTPCWTTIPAGCPQKWVFGDTLYRRGLAVPPDFITNFDETDCVPDCSPYLPAWLGQEV